MPGEYIDHEGDVDESLPSRHVSEVGNPQQIWSFSLEHALDLVARTRGEDVVVSRHGKPLVRITRLTEAKRTVRFGLLKGKLTVPEDFDAPLPDDVLRAFKGR